ncbi:MAG TPA: hypothetical protein PLL50_04530 [Propionicimonas sp.]|nr:hypothetical protein [Propionicimonas sp.]HQA77606.1 hypothetical protein [Propionicimonas sp.]HQD95956.1 hypothetical protein [Propionicimonas sp.]
MKRLLVTWLALVLLSGCAAGASSTSAPPPPKQVTITLADGKAEPIAEKVELVKGQHLVLTITSDRADAVHVHGFDVEIEVKAGETVTRDLVMDKVGRFEVESHEPVFTLLQLQIQ